MEKMTKKEKFDIVIAGYGGQGVLSLAEIIANAALKQGYNVKESELHGLAQRGGSLECHIRIGKQINSPIVTRGNADLIIAFDSLEAFRACYWANNRTAVLTNKKAFRSSMEIGEIFAKIAKIAKLYTINADEIVEKITKDIIAVNIFMLGYAIKKRLLPLKKNLVWKAISEKIRPVFINETRKVFEVAFR